MQSYRIAIRNNGATASRSIGAFNTDTGAKRAVTRGELGGMQLGTRVTLERKGEPSTDAPDGWHPVASLTVSPGKDTWKPVEKAVAPQPAPQMEVCQGCEKPAPNVGPWEDGRRLCGSCKVRITLADPARKKRLKEELSTMLRNV